MHVLVCMIQGRKNYYAYVPLEKLSNINLNEIDGKDAHLSDPIYGKVVESLFDRFGLGINNENTDLKQYLDFDFSIVVDQIILITWL